MVRLKTKTTAPNSSPSFFDGGLGCQLERDAELLRAERTHEHPAIVLPLENGVVEARVAGEKWRVDRSVFLLVSAKTPYRFSVVSAAPRVLTILVGPRALSLAESEYRGHVLPDTFSKILSASHILPRTRWFDELAHRHFFERGISALHETAAARFLETEITKELFFLGKEKLEAHSRTSVLHEGSELVKRASQFIEENLFRSIGVREIADECHVSESTLLRAFRRELGMAPRDYASGRRLDEALLLLQSGRYTVGEISARVGYTNLPAFTSAFRRRYGVPPSRLTFATQPDLGPSGVPRRKRVAV